MGEAINGGRERAYQALHDSEELHRITLSSISDAVFLTDDDGAFTFICPNVDVIFGYVPDEVQAMSRISRLLGEKLFDRSELRSRKEIRNIEREVTSKSGERRCLLIHLKEVTIQGGTVLYCCRDVTDRRHAEDEVRTLRRELAHASRFSLLGELAASISHEINQPLTAILADTGAGLRLLNARTDGDTTGEVREILSAVHDQARLASDVIERLRASAGNRLVARQVLDPNDAIRDVLRLAAGELRRRGVTFSLDLAPGLPAITADRVSLQQVMLNLLLNGMDAMDHLPPTERRLMVRTSLQRDTIEISVSDNGRGIPTDSQPRLFEPFYTTRQNGLGLGLSIARTIVESHDGRIWAEDGGGRGATLHVSLPISKTEESP
jgi:two-component system, LuxR family, sensor kinase FixL